MPEWTLAFAAYAAEHPGIGPPLVDIAYLPPDWTRATQYSATHVLVYTAGRVYCCPLAAPGPPPADARIQTRYGPCSEPANAAIKRAWPEPLWKDAAEISKLESGWDPDARNNTTDDVGPCGTQYYIPGVGPALAEDSIGLYQVNRCGWGGTVAQLCDPDYNAAKGYEIYRAQGWSAWAHSSQMLGLI